MAIISANLQFNRGGHGLLDYSSLQANYSAALAWAQDPNSNAAIGQFIYLENAETIEDVTYAKGPYVVDAIGEGAVLTPLSKSVAGEQDLSGAISDLQGEVDKLKTNLSDKVDKIANHSLVSDELISKLNALANIKSVGDNLSIDDEGKLSVDLSNLVAKEEGKGLSTNDFTNELLEKLNAIAAGAEVNYIKSVGDNLSVDENGKLTVTIPEVEVPFQSVAADDKVLTLADGVLSSSLSFTKETIEDVEYLIVKGKDGVEIGKVDTSDFVVDGMLDSVSFKTDEEGNKTNELIFVFNTESGKESITIDFSKYIDIYKGDNETIVLDSSTNTFKVKENVFDTYGAAASAETAAKEYANTLVEGYYTKEEADGLFLTGITVDTEISTESENPVQNKVIATKLDEIVNEFNTNLGDYLKRAELVGSATIDVTTEDDNIVISAKVSEEENNAIVAKEDGIFVQQLLVEGDDIEKDEEVIE